MNATFSLLQEQTSPAEVLEILAARYGLSRRQAYRYVRLARKAAAPLPVPEPKKVFTVKLSSRLITQIRRHARRERSAISSWVEQALRRKLDSGSGHG